MEKVIVNDDACIGCGACQAIAPDVFEINEDGLSIVINNIVNDDVIDAVNGCPTAAIEITEDEKED